MAGGRVHRIDDLPASVYSSIVLLRVVAVSFLTFWSALLGVELLEQSGLFDFPDQRVDEYVDTTVTSLGVAIPNSSEQRPTGLPIFFAALPAASKSQPVPRVQVAREAPFLRRDSCLYRLHRSLLL